MYIYGHEHCQRVRVSISKIKNGKAVGPSAGVDSITDLVNEIIVGGVILAEWELSTFVN